ncbi:MAG: GspE/PulE family protein [Thermodesulfobacteriota bacterium]
MGEVKEAPRLRIGDLLRQRGLLQDKHLTVAMAEQAVTGALLGEVLVRLGFVTSADLAEALAEQSGMEFVDLDEVSMSREALRLIPRETAESMEFIPLNLEDGTLSIGIVKTTNLKAIDFATKLMGTPPRVFVVDSESFYNTIERVYFFMENPIKEQIKELIDNNKVTTTAEAMNTSRLTELLIQDGIRRNATDIHITPLLDSVHVFYRIDGVLQHAHCLPRTYKNSVSSRIKILSELDIAEQRIPQDGSFVFSFLSKDFAVRTSFVPTVYGENIVLRVLGGGRALSSLQGLGFAESEVAKIRDLFSKPYGLIIVSGPTGSGKTTTLYSAMRELNLLEKNILTVEDPVEYRLAMTRQTSVSEKAGYDFALAGRSFMRQDPDVMLLGEIRDEETASMAVRGSITGHLVLSTLHANDAASVIPRLIDLKIDRFLLSTALLAVISQRLVRKICDRCKVEFRPGQEYLNAFVMEKLHERVTTAWKGEGCPRCRGTGYAGRMVIGELFVVTDEIREMIYSAASVNVMKAAALDSGMVSMSRRGIEKALEGVTTFDEVRRVTG